MDTVKRFFDAVANDEGLRERANAMSGKYKGEKPDEAAVKAELLSFAKSEGYDFTESELDAFTDRRRRELNDDELDAVAGGASVGFEHTLTKTGGCGCVVLGGGGGTTIDDTTWGCGCAGYGQGGDAVKYHNICMCVGSGVGEGIIPS